VVAFGSHAMQPAAPRLHATRTSLGTAQAWLTARLAGLGTNDVSATQYHMGAPAPRSSSHASATCSALSYSSARQSGRRLPLLARHAASTPTSAPALALLRVEASHFTRTVAIGTASTSRMGFSQALPECGPSCDVLAIQLP
jgi:hypothetical protein